MAIERIEKYAVRGRQALANEELLQTWVVHHLMIIRRGLPRTVSGLSAEHPADVWALAAGLRNVIVHQYFGVDLLTRS